MKKDISAQQIPIAEQNQLFAAMSEQAKERLRPLLEPVTLKRDAVLYAPETSMEYVYFPIDAIVAITFVTANGTTAEVSVIGNDGLVGVHSLLSNENTSTKAFVMSAGFVYRLSMHAMQDEFNRHDSTLLLVLRYLQTLITQISLTAACNRHHTIEQQFSKLLLLSLDRLPCNNLTFTQELVSVMLGVRREGITEAAVKLQKSGVIEYHRGHITVLDRTKLEQSCCECYEILKKETNKLLPRKAINLPVALAYAAHPNSLIEPKCVHCFKFGSCIYLRNNIKQATRKCITTTQVK